MVTGTVGLDGVCARAMALIAPSDRAIQMAVGTFFILDRKSTRLNSSHGYISYAVFCLKKKKKTHSRLRVSSHSIANECIHLVQITNMRKLYLQQRPSHTMILDTYILYTPHSTP